MKREYHNGKGTRLYNTWCNMKKRCNNQKDPSYSNYGGRGISVCKEWKESFITFKDWSILNGYNDTLSIDRIDNEGNYEPSNCRWVTSKIQANNKRTNILIDGKSLTSKCEELGVDSRLIQARMREQNMSFDEAVKTPHNFRVYKIRYNDKEYSLKSISLEFGLNYSTVHKRLIKYGWSLQEALNNKAGECVLARIEVRDD